MGGTVRTFFFTYRVVATNQYGEIFIRTDMQKLSRTQLKDAVKELHGVTLFNVLSLVEHDSRLLSINEWEEDVKDIGAVKYPDGNYMTLFG